MAQIVKNIRVDWTWAIGPAPLGDASSVKGFNVVLVPALIDPNTTDTSQIIASATVPPAPTPGDPVAHVFHNVVLNVGDDYTAWVQTLYQGKDSVWVNSGNLPTVVDDGIATISNTTYYYVAIGDAPTGKLDDVLIDITDGNQIYIHDGTDWIKGKSGTSARILNLTATSQVFIIPTNNGTVTPASITFEATPINFSQNLTYVWYVDDTLQPLETDFFFTMASSFFSSGSRTVKCVATDDDFDETTAFDEISVYYVKEGDDALIGYITNEAHTVNCDEYGTVKGGEYTAFIGEMKVLLGATELTSNVVYSRVSETGVAGTIDISTGVIGISNLTQNTGTILFRATYDGSYVVDKILTVTKAIDGGNSVSGVLTNEVHTVSATVAGTGFDLTGAGGTFNVFYGSTDVTTGAGSATFTGSMTKNLLSIIIDADTGVYSLSGNSWSSDTETFTLTATYETAVINKIYTISKSKAGAVGVDATYVQISGDQTFKYLEGSSVPVATSIVLHAELYGGLTAYLWEYYTGATWASLADTPNDAQDYTLTHGHSEWSTDTTLRVRCSSGGKSDEMTISKLYDGSNALAGFLTNEAHTAPTDSDGGSIVYTGSNGSFKLFKGVTDISTGATPAVVYSGTATKNGLTITINSSTGAYSLSGAGWSTASESFVLTATWDGSVLTKTYSLSKAFAGVDGPEGPLISLTATRQTFSFTDGASDGDATITLTANKQNTSEVVTWTSIPNKVNGTGDSKTLSSATFGTSTNCVITITTPSGLTDKLTIMRLNQSTADAGADVTLDNPQDVDWPNGNYTNSGTVPPAGGWYRIAMNVGNRAHGRFIVRNTESGKHNTIEFTCGTHYNNASEVSFSLSASSTYSTQIMTQARILTKTTYDEQFLEIFMVSPAGTVDGFQYWIFDNVQTSGWVGVDWVLSDSTFEVVLGETVFDVGQPLYGYTETLYYIGQDYISNGTKGALVQSVQIDAGGIYMGSGSVIQTLNKNTYDNSTAGYFMGGTKFGIGTAANYLQFDGTNLSLKGNLTILGSAIPLTESNTLNANTTSGDVSGLGSLAVKNSVAAVGGDITGLGGLAVKNSVAATGGEVTGLGGLAVLSEVGTGQLNSTVISGGKIITGILTASNIQTGTLNASVVTVSNINATNINAGTLKSSSLGGGLALWELNTTGSLTIRNSSGGTILSSGGTTSLVSSGNKITSGNAGTYISDLAVDTLKIADHAITADIVGWTVTGSTSVSNNTVACQVDLTLATVDLFADQLLMVECPFIADGSDIYGLIDPFSGALAFYGVLGESTTSGRSVIDFDAQLFVGGVSRDFGLELRLPWYSDGANGNKFFTIDGKVGNYLPADAAGNWQRNSGGLYRNPAGDQWSSMRAMTYKPTADAVDQVVMLRLRLLRYATTIVSGSFYVKPFLYKISNNKK
jgi:hypothetical protein